MVRRLPNVKKLIPRTLVSPLRILVTIASPSDAPYLEVGRERATLEESLATAVKNAQVKLEFLEHATKSKLQQALRVFKPHLFHFIGHGVFQRDETVPQRIHEQGALVFENEEGKTDPLAGAALKTMMGVDSSISVAILNSCETGTTGLEDAISGVAQILVGTGTPAVIATMRSILDQTALMFTREFYRSFIDGYTLEASVIEARKNLSINKGDWPAYALFVGTTELDDFRLVPSQRGNE